MAFEASPYTSGSDSVARVLVSSSSSSSPGRRMALAQQKVRLSQQQDQHQSGDSSSSDYPLPHHYYYNTTPRHPPEIEHRIRDTDLRRASVPSPQQVNTPPQLHTANGVESGSTLDTRRRKSAQRLSSIASSSRQEYTSGIPMTASPQPVRAAGTPVYSRQSQSPIKAPGMYLRSLLHRNKSIRRTGSMTRTSSIRRTGTVIGRNSSIRRTGTVRRARFSNPLTSRSGNKDELRSIPYDHTRPAQVGMAPKGRPMMLIRHRTTTRSARGSPVREFFRKLLQKLRTRYGSNKAVYNFTEDQLKRQLSFSIDETPNRRSKYEIKSMELLGFRPKIKRVPIIHDNASAHTASSPSNDLYSSASINTSVIQRQSDALAQDAGSIDTPQLHSGRGRQLSQENVIMQQYHSLEPPQGVTAEYDYTSGESSDQPPRRRKSVQTQTSPQLERSQSQFTRKRSILSRKSTRRSQRDKYTLPVIQRIDLYDNPNPAVKLDHNSSLRRSIRRVRPQSQSGRDGGAPDDTDTPEVSEALAFVEAWSSYLRRAVAVRVVLRQEIHSIEEEEEENWARASSDSASTTTSTSTASHSEYSSDGGSIHSVSSLTSSGSTISASTTSSRSSSTASRHIIEDKELTALPRHETHMSALSGASSERRRHSRTHSHGRPASRLEKRMAELESSLVLDSMYEKYKSLVSRPMGRQVSNPGDPVRPAALTPDSSPGHISVSTPMSKRHSTPPAPLRVTPRRAVSDVPLAVTPGWDKALAAQEAQQKRSTSASTKEKVPTTLPYGYPDMEGMWFSRNVVSPPPSPPDENKVLNVEKRIPSDGSDPKCQTCSLPEKAPRPVDLNKPLPEIPLEIPSGSDELLKQFLAEISMLEDKRAEAKRMSARYRDSAMKTPSPVSSTHEFSPPPTIREREQDSLVSQPPPPASVAGRPMQWARGHSRSASAADSIASHLSSGASLSRGARNMRRSRLMMDKRMSLNTAWGPNRRLDDEQSVTSSAFESDLESMDRTGMLVAVGDVSQPPSATQEHFFI
uniref:ARAD1D17182p n=1 Tax=Blastobotrys adeninivorans TaxID=409370 RepID=A0A060TFU1_BLAAD